MHKNKEPLFHIIKKDELGLSGKAVVKAVGILLALVLSALFIHFVTRLDPVNVYVSMFKGAF